MQDLHNTSRVISSVRAVAIGANATKTGVIVDRKGYGGVEFIATYGAVTTTGTICTLVLFEGDVTGTMTSIADANLLGTEALASLLATTPRTSGTAQNVAKRVGYIGNKRYVQAKTVSTGTTSVGVVSVNVVLYNPEISATANP
jgi:hypothetical protein